MTRITNMRTGSNADRHHGNETDNNNEQNNNVGTYGTMVIPMGVLV